MKKLLPFILGFAVVTSVTAQTVKPKAQTSEKHKLVGEFLAKSKIFPTISMLSYIIATQLNFKTIEEVPACLMPDRLKHNAIKFLLDQYNKDMFILGNRWLDSPVYAQVLEIINQPIDVFKPDDNLMNGISAKRRGLILRLDAAMLFDANSKSILRLQSLAVGAYDGKIPQGLVNSMIKTYLDQNKDYLRDKSLNRLAFLVKDLPEDKLERFVQELEQPVAQWSLAAIRGAIEASILRSLPELHKN